MVRNARIQILRKPFLVQFFYGDSFLFNSNIRFWNTLPVFKKILDHLPHAAPLKVQSGRVTCTELCEDETVLRVKGGASIPVLTGEIWGDLWGA